MKLYKVVAGSLTRGDKRYGFGDTIELTDAEAGSAFYKSRVLEVGARVPVQDGARVAELESELAAAEARIQQLESELAAGVTAEAEAQQPTVSTEEDPTPAKQRKK